MCDDSLLDDVVLFEYEQLFLRNQHYAHDQLVV